jgi:hypothetical protein
MLAQGLLDDAHEDVEHGRDRSAVLPQKVAQTFGKRQYPLAYRQPREHVIDQVRGRLRHPPGIAGGTDTTPLAGEGDQEVVPAFWTPGTGKPVSQDAAFQVAAELPLHIAGMGLASHPSPDRLR